MNFEKLSRIAKGVVEETLLDLPLEIRRATDEVPIFFELQPDEDDLASGVAPDTLGLFDQGAPEAPAPRIRLWLENLWDFSEEVREVFREEVRTTLLHELGHFLGWDEEDLEERGLG
ncbi:MAG: metallopeptidase family protein [Verrucomicrobiota bacterium]